jgi:aminoglycoside phosphotransferase (APT) family kinase protein
MHGAVGAFDRVGAPPGVLPFDPAVLAHFCRGAVPDFVGPLEVAQFHGGASNPTYLLTDTATDARYVLRKQPAGPLLASAHAVDREYRVMRALAGTAVPVPAMIAFGDDPRVVGTPFYLMPFLEARIYRDNRLADMVPADRTAAYRGIATTLAALHAIDPAAVGLGDFGRAGNYFARQVARWTRQYREAGGRGISAMDTLIERLPAAIPADEAVAIVHGDCRMENWMFALDAPRPIALLDWELSTLGHPIADLAFFCLFYHADFMPWGSAATIDFAATGIPDEAAFVAMYADAAGRDGIADWHFHLAFAAFRLAAIAEGVSRRMGGVDTQAGAWADLALRLFERGHDTRTL